MIEGYSSPHARVYDYLLTQEVIDDRTLVKMSRELDLDLEFSKELAQRFEDDTLLGFQL